MVPYENAVGSHVPVTAFAREAGRIVATSARMMSARPLTAVKHTRRVLADLAALARRRDLLADFAWRELRARYKGSVLGFAWNFVNPVLQLIVFWLLFCVVLRTRPVTATGEQPYAIFLLVGLLPWTFFATSLQSGASAILANGPLVKKVRMPLQLLPAASVLSALANFLLSFLVLLAILAIFGARHPEGVLWVPLLVALQIVINLSFAYLLS